MANNIFRRTSVRNFTHDPVADTDIEQLMRAAMAAPSAGNQQPWELYYTTAPAVRAELARASQYAKAAGEAPLVIVPCTRVESLRFPEMAPSDMANCCENILLEAVDLGLGGVWLGIAPLEDRMARAAAALSLPAELKPYALLAIGHPVVERAQLDRYDSARVHRVG